MAINLLIRECVKHPKTRHGYVTSTYKAAKNIVWRDPNMLKRYLPMDVVKKFNESELYVEFNNGSILSLHGSDDPDSLRGLDFKGVVVDEWALCKPIIWYEILQPIIRQSTDRWAMFIFTPKGLTHAYQTWNDAATSDDWKRYDLKASESGLLPKEELAKAKAEMPSNLYQQEFECSFIADNEYTVIKSEDVIENINASFPDIYDIKKITVADISGEGNDETVIYNMINTKIDSQEIYRHHTLMDTVGRIQANAKRHNSNLIAVDKIGEGSGVCSRLKEVYANDVGMRVYGYDGRLKARDTETYANYRAESIFKAAKMFQERKCSIPDDSVLVKQLTAFTYKYLSNGKIIIDKKEKIFEKIGCSPDRADAYIMGLDALNRAEVFKPIDRYKVYDQEYGYDYDLNPSTV